MILNDVSNSALDTIGQFVFPNTTTPIRRRDTRAFLASLVVGVIVCFLFGYLLCLANKHGV